MKCKNCGATFSGMTCPVCGHKQLKNAECSVCFTRLFPSQEYCPKCGSPTLYRKTNDVKRITPDTIVHSKESHNFDTVSESYDYKKDAYQYQEDCKKQNVISFASIFEPLKNNKFNYQKLKDNKFNNQEYQKIKKASQKRVIPVPVIVISVFLVLCIISTTIFVENTSVDDNIVGNMELSDFVLDTDTRQSEYNYYANGNSLSYAYDHQLFVSTYDGIMVYQPDEDPFLLVDDIDCKDLYVNENGVYYKNIDDEYVVYHDGAREVLLDGVEQCYQLGQDIIYLDYTGLLLRYHIDKQATEILFQNVSSFIVDDVNQIILLYDDDLEETLIDFSGEVLMENMTETFNEGYFSNGYLYFEDVDAINRQDVMSGKVESVFENTNYNSFAFTKKNENDILYVITQEGTLEVYSSDGDGDMIAICEDVESFYPIGDKVVFYCYDSDYNRTFYIGDIEGNFARLE